MKLGIVCGLQSEKAALGRLDHACAISGANAARAYEGAKRLAGEGAECLVSIGLAGALMAHLKPGDLLLPEAVVDRDGRRFRCHPLSGELPRSAHGAPVLGADDIIRTPEEKAELARTFGASAVDMESHAVARAAFEHHLPLYVIRAVADTAAQALPPSTEGAVQEDGSVNSLKTIAGLLARPGDLPDLIALGTQASKGLETLRTKGRGLIAALAAA
ncbi:phosphorylase family protein [Parvularcula lutaonensis]|uniref:Purine phosphorylase n=1 Tax=Parvularcula lutaonensis TaxID=491923 RepID=A0ABV7M917_9PROT|nr:purine phosphorylase [Parvularcula lutaonensis]GGY46197.1 purine phosphorylase [Parvularcula lutaonensis]